MTAKSGYTKQFDIHLFLDYLVVFEIQVVSLYQ